MSNSFGSGDNAVLVARRLDAERHGNLIQREKLSNREVSALPSLVRALHQALIHKSFAMSNTSGDLIRAVEFLGMPFWSW